MSWARWSRERRTIRRSPMKHAQSRATESAIAAKPCPVILAIGIQPTLRALLLQSAYQCLRCLFSYEFGLPSAIVCRGNGTGDTVPRSEERTSELQSLRHLVCRLLLEKK